MIGFLGGAFDPVHYGHLNNARLIKKELNLEQLFLMPCKIPVHKNMPLFSSQARLDMLNLSLKEFNELRIDTREIEQDSPSYTIDSLKQIKQEYPDKSIFLIMGSDSFATLETWKDYQLLTKLSQIVVLPRSKNSRQHKACSTIYFAKTPLVDISSTQIRNKIRTHQDLSGLMPDNVIQYIQQL